MFRDEILAYCEAECVRQGDPGGTLRFEAAWDYALARKSMSLSIEDILILASIVILGVTDFRKIPVIFANGGHGLEDSLIERAMNNLFQAIEDKRISADLAYLEFEKIHPFVDGNGRLGKILYNHILGTLENPVLPPIFFPESVP